MTQVSVAGGLIYPAFQGVWSVTANGFIMDAAGERWGMMGHCYINGRPGSSKTISAAGGGSISFRTGTTTFANAGTTVDIGIQDVEATTGNPGRPDDTYDVKNTFTGGGGGITSGAWNTASMTGGSGSKTIAHGDLIAVVFHMTARGGVDSVLISTLDAAALSGTSSTVQRPWCAANVGSWASATLVLPLCVITFDDGTLGIIDCCYPFTSSANEAWADATNPDERGPIFQVPWDCKIDGFWANMSSDNATTADFTMAVYSTPLGTPAVVSGASITVLAEQMGPISSQRGTFFLLPAEVSLTKNTDYCLALRNTGTGNISVRQGTLGSTNYRPFLPNGSNLRKGTRQNGTGAFAEESPAITMYQMGVRISSFDDGTGTGAAGGSSYMRRR